METAVVSIPVTINGVPAGTAQTFVAFGAGVSLALDTDTAAHDCSLYWKRAGVAAAFFSNIGTAGDLATGTLVGDQIVRMVSGRVVYSLDNGTTLNYILTSTGLSLTGNLGINGSAPPAKVTGWGTPTSPAVVANFSGTAATNAQLLQAVAQIITDLKAVGLYGA